MSVREINDEAHFQSELHNAGIKLVVVDFTAAWCGPCKAIGPLFNQLPAKYPKAIFLKVDVDKCQETAAMQGVSAMPTFIFYRNRTKIDKITGADINGLEAKIKQHYSDSDAGGDEKDYGQGLMDLGIFIMKDMCECLNESDDHNLKGCFGEGYLASDCDEQLIISIQFNQAVKIHSIIMKAPADHGPKTIKLFINQPNFSFDQLSSTVPIQEIEVNPKDLTDQNMINLRFVKFQNVQNIVMFIVDNQNGSDRTVIQDLTFIGAPIQTTKMDDFKRISGKKGESH